MAGVKNPNSDSTLDRRPIARGADQGVTIEVIEGRVAEIYPETALNDRRSLSLLFAILKQGTSLQKLQWFTRYDARFIGERLDALRDRGLIFTGALSPRYILSQAPGSEELIEKITGQRMVTEPATPAAAALGDWEKNLVRPPAASLAPHPAANPINQINRKDEPMTTTAVNGLAAEAEVAAAEPTCLKTHGCPRPAGHNGICKGQKMNRRAAAAKAKPAKPPRAKAARPRPAPARSYADARTHMTATAAAADPGYFKIEFEDEEDTISREGHGREGFARALKALHQEFAGGSNG